MASDLVERLRKRKFCKDGVLRQPEKVKREAADRITQQDAVIAGLVEALENAVCLIAQSVPLKTDALVAGERITAEGVWYAGRDALAKAKESRDV